MKELLSYNDCGMAVEQARTYQCHLMQRDPDTVLQYGACYVKYSMWTCWSVSGVSVGSRACALYVCVLFSMQSLPLRLWLTNGSGPARLIPNPASCAASNPLKTPLRGGAGRVGVEVLHGVLVETLPNVEDTRAGEVPYLEYIGHCLPGIHPIS